MWPKALIVTLIFSSSAQAQSALSPPAYQFTFTRVEVNPFSIRDADPDPQYSVDIAGPTRTQRSYTKSELQAVAAYLGVKSVEDLLGKAYASDLPAPYDSMSLLIATALHRGHYVPPTADQFFDDLARRVSQGNCPRIYDGTTDNLTLEKVSTKPFLANGDLDPVWVRTFNQSVWNHSSRQLFVQIANDTDYGSKVLWVKRRQGVPVMRISLAPIAYGLGCLPTGPDGKKRLAQTPEIRVAPAAATLPPY